MSILPKISIVIPSYNQGNFIERTIQSIISQNYPNIEIILMDGGSTDNTMSIIESHRHHFAHIESRPDGGQSAAIANGFSLATGEFISWLNSDDTYSPGSLMAIGKALAERPHCDFIYGHTHLIDENDEIIAYKRSAPALLGVMKYAFLTVPQMSAFWRKTLYETVGGIDRSLRFCMDYDLFVRLASVTQPVLVNADIGNFRLHGSSKTRTMEHVRIAEDSLVQARYCRVKPGSPLFPIIRIFWLGVVAGLFLFNGSLFTRLSARIRNNMRSECS
jgi:glycosyltransferase involved in cell wall biosynthesis